MKRLIHLLSVIFCFTAYSQNLVPNHSFENYDTTYVPTISPFFNHTFESIYDWRTEWDMFNTPDLFFEGSYNFFVNIPDFPSISTTYNVDEFYVSVPNNYAGSQTPRTGLRYIGLRSETPNVLNTDSSFTISPYQEYIQVELSQTLEAGKSYEVAFFISSAENNVFQNNSLGVLLSQGSELNLVYPYTPDITSADSVVSTLEWEEIKGNYVAQGGEKFLTIGNLQLSYIDTFVLAGQFKPIYYYLDDVSVFENKIIDTNLCVNESIVLSAFPNSSEHLWQDGSTDSIFVASQSGTYWYRGKYDNIYHTDTFKIEYYEPLTISTPPDAVICHYESIELSASHNSPYDVKYNWNTGDTTNSIFVSDPGQYIVSVQNLCENVEDTIVISEIPKIEFDLGKDTTLCYNESIVLSPQINNQCQYKWHDNSSGLDFEAKSSGKYWLTISNECESISDTINVEVLSPIFLDLGPNLKVCEFPIIVEATDNNQTQFLWHDGSNENYYSDQDSSKIWVRVFNECESASDTVDIKLFCGCKLYIPSAFTPNGDNDNDKFDIIATQCDLNNYELTIYNRWGQEIFQTNDINSSWDGSYKNEKVQDGVYIYSLQYLFSEMPIQRILGKVQLLK